MCELAAQLEKGDAAVRCHHERLAYEHSVHAAAVEMHQLCCRFQTAFRNAQNTAGHMGEDPQRVVYVDGEALEVAVVDAQYANEPKVQLVQLL